MPENRFVFYMQWAHQMFSSRILGSLNICIKYTYVTCGHMHSGLLRLTLQYELTRQCEMLKGS